MRSTITLLSLTLVAHRFRPGTAFGCHPVSPSGQPEKRPLSAVVRSFPRTYSPRPFPTVLLAKKRAAPAAPSKLQVRLLKRVPGTGQKGDVVMVTPAFYQNKLQPDRAAEIISDEQVQRERTVQQAKLAETKGKALSLKERLEAEGFQLFIKKKAGPDGQLFGGVGPKVILTELQQRLSDDFLKNCRIGSILDESKKALSGDIKRIGIYEATIELTKEDKACFPVTIEAE